MRAASKAGSSYAAAILLFSLVTMVFTYVVLRFQDHLPFHGIIDGLANKTPITPDLAFNTAASFTTNTNWQSYSGENTMSYFSQMVGLASHNFWSAAVGIAVAAALVRGIARHESGTVGNFWVDLVRIHYYLLLPICMVYAVFLISQGIPQNFNPYDTAQLTEKQTIQVPKTDASNNPVKDAAGNVVLQDQPVETQSIVEGPIASQMAIKMLGTNGGGFVNANAAHPFENPTPLSNFMQMLSIFAIPSALTYYLGRMVKNQKHGWAVWGAMAASVPRRRRHLLEGRGGRQPEPVPATASSRPTATWRARRCASASSTPPCSPRSRRMPRAARSTPCTTASRPSAGWCRCSTSSSARSSSAASVRACTAC